jgi:uncharacterized membrane protein
VKNSFFSQFRANFFAGLTISLPAIISIKLLAWLFGTASTITDVLLIFIPHEITHEAKDGKLGEGPLHWYWSVVALCLAVVLIVLIGMLAGNFIGRKIIELVDGWLLRIPFLNKIYGTTKQVNDAFASGSSGTFKTVVLVEFPRQGLFSVGFLTSRLQPEMQNKLPEKMVCVFVPGTPNPTGGFLIIVREDQITKLDMTVADGIKFIISLGAIGPEHAGQRGDKTAPPA